MSINRSRLISRTASMFAAFTLLMVVGCSTCVTCTSWSNSTRIHRDARADVVKNLESRVVEANVSLAPDQTLRLTHVAGPVTLQQADVEQAQLRATVYAKADSSVTTSQLLDNMHWTTYPHDDDNRPHWTLSWPTNAHRTLHYTYSDQDGSKGGGFTVISDRFDNRTITVTTQKDRGTPTLFADITVTYPTGSSIAVHTLAGGITADSLRGTTELCTAIGAVEVNRLEGDATIDTAASHVNVGTLVGKALIETGSGDITIGRAEGGGTFDTGSGNITVNSITGRGHFETGSGNIHVMAIDTNNIYADTGSGDITLESGNAGHIVADTGSGDIELLDVGFVSFRGDTGSGDLRINSSLKDAVSIEADTGSGDVIILAEHDAAFDVTTDFGSGRLKCDYKNVTTRYDGDELIGVRHGSGKTRIYVDTGSGDCVIRPRDVTS